MLAIDVLWVGIGGGIGSLIRWWIGVLVKKKYHGIFPLATFLINISGAFIIAYLSVLFLVDWHDRYGDFLHSSILTGLLGGYTTFSSMQLDAAKLVNQKQTILAVTYLILSVLSGLSAAAIGAWLAY